MEMGVGASTWASGSQVCTGTTGSFTANVINRAIKTRICVPTFIMLPGWWMAEATVL